MIKLALCHEKGSFLAKNLNEFPVLLDMSQHGMSEFGVIKIDPGEVIYSTDIILFNEERPIGFARPSRFRLPSEGLSPSPKKRGLFGSKNVDRMNLHN